MIYRESREQQALFEWAAYHKELKKMFHIPNGGKRNAREAARFKLEGVKAGVPDIFLPVPKKKYHGLFIELKAGKKGRVTDNQNEWLAYLADKGYLTAVCYGWQEAKEVITRYMGI